MKKMFLLASLFLISAAPGFAQLTVNDPAGLAQAIKRLEAMETQIQNQEKHILIAQQHLQTSLQILSNAQKQLAFAQSQYGLFTSEYTSIKSLPDRYRYSFTNWQQFAAGNQYGNTNLWATAVTNGNANSIQTAFRNLLPPILAADVTATPQAQQDWRQQYGLIQLQDASLMTGMKAIGDIRTNIQQNANVLAQLEADATSTDPTLQSTKALQQKTLIAILMMIRTLQDTNRALTSSMDLEIQALAQQRWERGRELNAAAAARQGH
ncbi:MAG TPA: hypothetical protein VKJ45_24755 [Blastocatellia bacterium]|nr:hypothetical protein [Blastocatellia bacterium]